MQDERYSNNAIDLGYILVTTPPARLRMEAHRGWERRRRGMTETSHKIVIIGGGVAGLCAGVYGRKCGFDAEVLEQHENAGGLATSWRRGDYAFETCLRWLLGANPARGMDQDAPTRPLTRRRTIVRTAAASINVRSGLVQVFGRRE